MSGLDSDSPFTELFGAEVGCWFWLTGVLLNATWALGDHWSSNNLKKQINKYLIKYVQCSVVVVQCTISFHDLRKISRKLFLSITWLCCTATALIPTTATAFTMWLRSNYNLSSQILNGFKLSDLLSSSAPARSSMRPAFGYEGVSFRLVINYFGS